MCERAYLQIQKRKVFLARYITNCKVLELLPEK